MAHTLHRRIERQRGRREPHLPVTSVGTPADLLARETQTVPVSAIFSRKMDNSFRQFAALLDENVDKTLNPLSSDRRKLRLRDCTRAIDDSLSAR